MTEKAQNADFRRKTPCPGNSSIWRAQETADFRRKPKIFAENRRKPQIGLRHLRCITFSSALLLPRNPTWESSHFSGAFIDTGAPVKSQRTPWGGEKRGERKTSRRTPSQRGFGPPFVWYVFHPPQASLLCFSCTKMHD